MKADLFTLSLIKMKSEISANAKINIIKNHVNDLMNEKLIMKEN